ncbi:MAG: saccharopine dehydrogenase C-terminal domain-containing protein [Candidatus Aminicenantes bacterium]
MNSVIVFGSGLVGASIALDLGADPDFKVCVVDKNPEALKILNAGHSIQTIISDLSKPQNIKNLVRGFDFVVSAVPGFMGFKTLKAVIEAGKNVVDIAFFPEDPFLLDHLAKNRSVTAVVDCGVAPGMTNMLAGYADRILDTTEALSIYVGGLPEVRQWPYEYKAGFSPLDVIEEYVRPARYVENGKMVVRQALSEPEFIEFPEIGTLEAFNTDGLRTLTRTLSIPNMKEKTLRYPGHIEKIAVLRETGFFSSEEIEVWGVKIRPMDITARLLFPKWQLKAGDRDLTVLKLSAEGRKKGRGMRYVYEMLDRYDPGTRIHSMARTTGYTATCMVRLLARGLFTDKGITPPEFIGRNPECTAFMLKGLKQRGVVYKERVESF